MTPASITDLIALLVFFVVSISVGWVVIGIALLYETLAIKIKKMARPFQGRAERHRGNANKNDV